MTEDPSGAAIDLYWLPLGAGGHSVRWNGRLYEALHARLERRSPQDLFHSALMVRIGSEVWAIEMTPAGTERDRSDRGVQAEGSVGTRWAGQWRRFRYEVHCRPGGTIADLAEAVSSPVRIASDEASCRRLLAAVPSVPTPVWGRDAFGTGEMWNSNSVISWVLASSGLDIRAIAPPVGGRAPGWGAGLVAARRQPMQHREPSAGPIP